MTAKKPSASKRGGKKMKLKRETLKDLAPAKTGQRVKGGIPFTIIFATYDDACAPSYLCGGTWSCPKNLC